jgi:hypothetical protein
LKAQLMRNVSGVFDVTRRPPGWRCSDMAGLSGPLARTVATSNAGDVDWPDTGHVSPSMTLARTAGRISPLTEPRRNIRPSPQARSRTPNHEPEPRTGNRERGSVNGRFYNARQ